jgi:hypothetical protein
MLAELQRSHFGADYLRDLAKSGYKAAVNLPKQSVSGVVKSIGKFGNSVDQFFAAREFEQTGKWPYSNSKDFASARFRSPQWRSDAMKLYRQVAATYSYVDPKTKRRVTDWDAINRGMSNDPVGTVAPVVLGGAGYAGKISTASRTAADLNRAKGFTDAAKINDLVAKGTKAVQIAGDVTARALNPAATAVSVAAKPVVKAVKAAIPIAVLDASGNFVPKVEEMMRQEGFDPALYSTPDARAHFQEILSKNGVSPASIRKAAGTLEGVPVSYSMAGRERAPADFRADVDQVRQQGAQNVAQRMEQQFGSAADERDLGSAFVRAYTNAKDGVQTAYRQAFSNQGVFTNVNDFTLGVKDAINQELGALNLDVDTVMSAPRFAQAQNALGGMRRGDRKFGGVFQQFDNLAGSAGTPAITLPDLSGEMHTFDPASKSWINASGAPVTAPGKIQYLNAASNRLAMPDAIPAQNGLTPQNIDGVRRDVNSFFTEAKTPEDKAALAAINRGIDNYVERNAANFTGDGRQLSQDLQNARAANQSFITSFDKSPNKVIRDASKITATGLAPDDSGIIKFVGDPNSVGAHLEGRIFDPKTLLPKTNYTGGNTVTGDAVFKDLYNVLDPDGQNALVSHVRNTAATSPAPSQNIASFMDRTDFFAPDEKDSILRLQNARGIATDSPINPSTSDKGTGTRWGMRISAPLIGQSVGQGVGGIFGPAGAQAGGWLGSMAGSAAQGKYEGVDRASRLKRELETTPQIPTTAPRLFAPITAAEAVTGVTGQSPLLQQPAPPPQQQEPQQQAPATPQQPRDAFSLPQSFAPAPRPQSQGPKDDPFALPDSFAPPKDDPYALPDSFKPEPQARGGRAAYNAGGKVGGIEPLIQALMNKAKMAKKASNKATEPLLNERDDAIANALAVAQKAI